MQYVIDVLQAQPTEPLWWMRWVPAAMLVVAAVCLLYVFGRVALVPVLASFAIAYLLHPIVCRLEQRGLSRSPAALLAMLVVGGGFICLFAFVIPTMWRQSLDAGTQVTASLSAENIARLRQQLVTISPAIDQLVGPRLEAVARDPSSILTAVNWWFAGSFTGILSTAAASLDFLLVPFFVYYILIDFAQWRVSLEQLIPPRFQRTFHPLLDEIGRILEAYVTGQLLVALGMAVLYAIGFWLLSLPAWAGIAAISGLLNMVPYVGTATGLVLATAFTLADGGGWIRLAGVVGVFVVVQNVEGFFLTPRILGGRLQLHPMAVFLGILIGGHRFGLLGILLAIPTIAVGKVLAKFAREMYVDSAFYRGEPPGAARPALETRLASASDEVMRQQRRAESGDELLVPDDDARAASPDG